MRRFSIFSFAFALLQLPALVFAQPGGDEDGDVGDEPAPEAAPAEPTEGAPPRRSRRARADAEPAAAADPEGDEGDTPDEPEPKVPKEKAASAEGDEAEAPPADAPPPAGAADDKKGPAAKKVLSEKAVGDARPGPELRAAASDGPIGLDRVWSADTGPAGTLRLKLALRTFTASEWPIKGGGDTSFTGTAFGLAFSPLDFLETFMLVKNTSSDNPDGRPRLIQTQGDVDVGFKIGRFFTRSLGAALGAEVHVLGGLGTTGANFDGVGYEARGLFTLDLKRAEQAPLRILLDVGYTVENGEAVYANQTQEPDLIQEWGLQAWRYDRLSVGLGLEVPLAPYVAPFVEYHIATPFQVEVSRRGRGAVGFDFASVPHSFTGGVRAFPVPEVALDAALRLGLSDKPFTGVPATPPWEVVLGLSYTLDPQPQVIEREVAPEKAEVVDTSVGLGGRVVDADGRPVANARITYSGKNIEVSAQVADSEGRFDGYRFAAGQVKVRVEAEGYGAKTVRTTLEAKDKKLKIKLKKDPALQKGRLEVRAFDGRGKAMTVQVVLDDPDRAAGEVKGDAPLVLEAKTGTYTLEASAKGHKTLRQSVEIKGGEATPVRLTMQKGSGVVAVGAEGARPAGLTPVAEPPARRGSLTPDVPADTGPVATLKGRRIQPVGKVDFTGDTAGLSAGGRKALNSVAALLKRDGKLKRVQVGVHTDNAGDPQALRTLTTQRAQAVKSYLVARGVAADRVTVQGFGADKPIAPNLSARGRAQNRRVELEVVEQAP